MLKGLIGRFRSPVGAFSVAAVTALPLDWASAEVDLLGPILVAEIEAYLKQQAPKPAPTPIAQPPIRHPGQYRHPWNTGHEHPTPTLLQRLRSQRPRTPVTTAQYLQLIGRYIQHHGWTQGLLWTPVGEVCILGARARVLAAGYGTPAVDEHAHQLLGNETRMPVNDWNDTEGRRVCDIHALLQAAGRRVN